jgi:guanylate kinase
LEHAIYSRNNYGTKLSDVDKAYAVWLVPITEVDMHGLENIKRDSKWIEYVSVFLNLDDEKMTERITKRWTIEQDEIDRRVAAAQGERVKAKELCDYILDTNFDLKINIKNLNTLVKNILNG